MKFTHKNKITIRFLVGTVMLMISLISVGQVSAAALSDTDVTSLTWMREEEKLARDVYISLYKMWRLPVFDNISKSEQTHMDAILTLLNRYGIDDPASSDVGVFNNQTLQDLYDDLIAKGNNSIIEALEVGVDIEVLDIADLAAEIAVTNLKDIKRVYTNLMNGSWNHYNAFVSNLAKRGVVYE